MRIVFIHHSAFFAELEKTVFLFDYFKGTLPQVPAGKTLIVLSSHAHGDHFGPRVFAETAKYPEARYVLSEDIPARAVPGAFGERTRRVSPGERLELDTAGGRCVIDVYRSNDAGCAFRIQCEGKVIYHAGDLNNWYWDGDAEDLMLGEMYREDLKKMAGLPADIAFVPLDPRLKDPYLGMQEYMAMVGAEHVFPMHCWGDFSLAAKMKREGACGDWAGRLYEIRGDGEEFIC